MGRIGSCIAISAHGRTELPVTVVCTELPVTFMHSPATLLHGHLLLLTAATQLTVYRPHRHSGTRCARPKRSNARLFVCLFRSPGAAHDPQAGAMAQPAAAATLGEQSSSPAGVPHTLASCRAGKTSCLSLLKPAGQLFLCVCFSASTHMLACDWHHTPGISWSYLNRHLSGSGTRHLQHLCRHGFC